MDSSLTFGSAELEQMLIFLARQTVTGKINWNLSHYCPISFLMDWESDGEIIFFTQSFDLVAELRGQNIHVFFDEMINLPSGKGDLSANILIGDDQLSGAISDADDYDSVQAGKVFERYEKSPLVIFAKFIVPYLVKKFPEELKLRGPYKFFFNGDDIPDELIQLPIVQKAMLQYKESQVLAFHDMALNT